MRRFRTLLQQPDGTLGVDRPLPRPLAAPPPELREALDALKLTVDERSLFDSWSVRKVHTRTEKP